MNRRSFLARLGGTLAALASGALGIDKLVEEAIPGDALAEVWSPPIRLFRIPPGSKIHRIQMVLTELVETPTASIEIGGDSFDHFPLCENVVDASHAVTITAAASSPPPTAEIQIWLEDGFGSQQVLTGPVP